VAARAFDLRGGQHHHLTPAAAPERLGATKYSEGIDQDRMKEAGQKINGWLEANRPG
jgi:hypothetical protein